MVGPTPHPDSWTPPPPQPGAPAAGLGSGTWTVTVTDANGCSGSLGGVIGGPTAALALDATGVTDVLCHGGSTGAATVLALSLIHISEPTRPY